MPLKQPPEFAARMGPGPNQPGIQSTTRVAPRTPDNNHSIAYDSGTHTYINRDGGNPAALVNLPTTRSNAPVAPAALMPPHDSQSAPPRLAQSPSGPLNSRTQRVILPPPYPTPSAPHGNFPVNGIVPARPQGNAPFNAIPRPVSPPPVAGPPASGGQSVPGFVRVPTGPPPAPPRPAATPPAPPPPAAPHPAAEGSTARPGAQTSKPDSPQNPADKR